MFTQRNCIFGFLLVLAAMPLIWLNADQHAGEKLLRWKASAAQKSSQSVLPAGVTRRTEATPEIALPIA